MGRRSSIIQGHLEDASQRGTVEDLFEFTACDVLAVTAEAGRRVHPARHVNEVPKTTQRAERPLLGRCVQRRDAHSRKRSGTAFRNTNSKAGISFIMVADRRGVPLEVRIAPASPSEVPLNESVLK